jgi:sRNA-binding protein
MVETRGSRQEAYEQTADKQTAGSRQQTAESRQQTAKSRQQRADSREQTAEKTAESRQQRADSREQTAERRQQRGGSRDEEAAQQRRQHSNSIYIALIHKAHSIRLRARDLAFRLLWLDVRSQWRTGLIAVRSQWVLHVISSRRALNACNCAREIGAAQRPWAHGKRHAADIAIRG